MFQLSIWCEKWVASRRNSVIGNQLLFANNRNMVRWVVLCVSHDGACTDSSENFRKISLKGDLSNDITLNPPLFSLVNTFNCKTLNDMKNSYNIHIKDLRWNKWLSFISPVYQTLYAMVLILCDHSYRQVEQKFFIQKRFPIFATF